MSPGEVMRKQRKKLNLTQHDLADLLNVSESTIQKYETGKNRIPSDRLAEVAVVLKISIGELLGFEEIREAQKEYADIENISYKSTSDFVETIIAEDRSKSDDMENTKRVLYYACIYYLEEAGEKNTGKEVFSKIFRLIESGIMSSRDKQPESTLDTLMSQAERAALERGEVSRAAANYNVFKIAAPDTERNVLISCLLDLQLLDNKSHFLKG